MALQVRMTVGATVYDSASQNFKFFELSREQVVDVFQRHTGKTVLVSATTTEAIDFGDFGASPANVRGIMVEVDQNVDLLVDFGSGDQTIPLRLPNSSSTTANKARFFLDGIPVSLSVDNSGGSSDVNVVLCVWGAPTS